MHLHLKCLWVGRKYVVLSFFQLYFNNQGPWLRCANTRRAAEAAGMKKKTIIELNSNIDIMQRIYTNKNLKNEDSN